MLSVQAGKISSSTLIRQLSHKSDVNTRLHLELMRRIPQRNLLDILVNVEHLTNFTNHFGPASDSEPKIERAAERYLLAVFAVGSSLGPVQAARHLGGSCPSLRSCSAETAYLLAWRSP